MKYVYVVILAFKITYIHHPGVGTPCSKSKSLHLPVADGLTMARGPIVPWILTLHTCGQDARHIHSNLRHAAGWLAGLVAGSVPQSSEAILRGPHMCVDNDFLHTTLLPK